MNEGGKNEIGSRRFAFHHLKKNVEYIICANINIHDEEIANCIKCTR